MFGLNSSEGAGAFKSFNQIIQVIDLTLTLFLEGTIMNTVHFMLIIVQNGCSSSSSIIMNEWSLKIWKVIGFGTGVDMCQLADKKKSCYGAVFTLCSPHVMLSWNDKFISIQQVEVPMTRAAVEESALLVLTGIL